MAECLGAYAYDPLGRRVAKTGTGVTTTYFLSDGNDEIADYDGAGALVTRYVPGPAIDDPIAMVTTAGTKTFVHENKQGSVIAMSGNSAALAEGPYTYDPYGNCVAGGSACSSGEPYRFTGRRFDPETGLSYYRARYYSSVLGRFLQTDPVGYTADLDLYTYVGNEPLNKLDPLGLATTCTASGDAERCAITADTATENAKGVPVTQRNPTDEAYGKSVISNLRSQTGEKSAYIGRDAKGNPEQKMTGTDKPTATGWKTETQAGPGMVTQHSHPEKGSDIAPGYLSKKNNDSSVIQKGGISQIFNRDRIGTLTVDQGGVVTYVIEGHATSQELQETQKNLDKFQGIMESLFTPQPPPK